MKKEFTIMNGVLLFLLALFIIFSGMLLIKVDGLKDDLAISQDKVKFYEEVIKDFGIEEFINYPYLYYNDEYREQAKVHNCMWAIDDAIEMSNKYHECARSLYGDNYEEE